MIDWRGTIHGWPFNKQNPFSNGSTAAQNNNTILGSNKWANKIIVSCTMLTSLAFQRHLQQNLAKDASSTCTGDIYTKKLVQRVTWYVHCLEQKAREENKEANWPLQPQHLKQKQHVYNFWWGYMPPGFQVPTLALFGSFFFFLNTLFLFCFPFFFSFFSFCVA